MQPGQPYESRVRSAQPFTETSTFCAEVENTYRFAFAPNVCVCPGIIVPENTVRPSDFTVTVAGVLVCTVPTTSPVVGAAGVFVGLGVIVGSGVGVRVGRGVGVDVGGGVGVRVGRGVGVFVGRRVGVLVGVGVAVARAAVFRTGVFRLTAGFGVLVGSGGVVAVGALAMLTSVGVSAARRSVGAATCGCVVGDGSTATAMLLGVGTVDATVLPDLDGGARNARYASASPTMASTAKAAATPKFGRQWRRATGARFAGWTISGGASPPPFSIWTKRCTRLDESRSRKSA